MGDRDGSIEGTTVKVSDGSMLGSAEGWYDGSTVGDRDGSIEGITVVVKDGSMLGSAEG